MKKNTFFCTVIALIGLTANALENDSLGLTETVLLNEIEFIEDEEVYDLGFDPTLYLPFGFDPYKGMVFESSEIKFVEEEPTIELGFDTSSYLPRGFNPYVGQ